MSHTNSKRERKKDRKKNTQAVLQYAGEVEDEEIISDGSASYNDTEFPIATPEKTDQPAVNLAVTEKTGSKIDGSTQQNVADPTVAQKADSQQAQPITKYNTDDGKKTSNPSRSKNQIAQREKTTELASTIPEHRPTTSEELRKQMTQKKTNIRWNYIN